MLTDKQSLLLCGLITAIIFVAGILGIMSNFIVLTVLTIAFLTLIANLFFWKHPEEKNDQEHTK